MAQWFTAISVNELPAGMHTAVEFDDAEIICPRHGARFCLKTGKVLSAPAFEDIDSYPDRVVNDIVQVFV